MPVGTDVADRGCDRPMPPADLRARAGSVRTLARFVAHDEAAPTLRAFADELEARAEALELREV
jgi:hypothetical protein